jgi:hypothetical protein
MTRTLSKWSEQIRRKKTSDAEYQQCMSPTITKREVRERRSMLLKRTCFLQQLQFHAFGVVFGSQAAEYRPELWY